MATKKKATKKKAAKRAAPKRPARRPAAPLSAAPAVESAPPKRNGLWLAILIVALLLAIFWRSRHQAQQGADGHAGHDHGAIGAPAGQAPEGRSPSSAEPKTASRPASAPVPKAQPTARREAADEVGAPALEFDRGSQKSLSVRCWRPEGGQAQLDVFGPRNQRMRTLRSESGTAGWQSLDWDGKDEQGRKVPAGLYYVRPSAPDLQQVRDVWVKG